MLGVWFLLLFTTEYVVKWAAMFTFLKFFDNIVESLEFLIIFLDIAFVLFQVDEIFGSLPHSFDGLLILSVVEIDCLEHFHSAITSFVL